jgi:hypothetical protein
MADSDPITPTSQLKGISSCEKLTLDHSVMDNAVNGNGIEYSLSPAQLRQLEADKDTASKTPSPRPRQYSNPPNLLSEGDFPTLGNAKSPPRPVMSWGAKRPASSTVSSPSSVPTTNGVNGKASSNSSRASTPLPTPRAAIQGTTVVTQFRLRKDQFHYPNAAKDMSPIFDKIKKATGVENIRMASSRDMMNFQITGKKSDNIKAKAKLLNEVGLKVTQGFHS